MSYQPPRIPRETKRNIEESDGTVIFSLERLLSGGTKLTLGLVNKLGKPVWRKQNPPGAIFPDTGEADTGEKPNISGFNEIALESNNNDTDKTKESSVM